MDGYIDVSQIEPGIPLTGAIALDRQANGRSYRRSRRTSMRVLTEAPLLGEHTAEVLADVGVDGIELQRLHEGGAVSLA